MVRLLLKRQRELSGLSLNEASKRLGAKPRNTYARCEHGILELSMEKLAELLQSVSPGRDFVFHQGIAVYLLSDQKKKEVAIFVKLFKKTTEESMKKPGRYGMLYTFIPVSDSVYNKITRKNSRFFKKKGLALHKSQ